MRIVGNEAGRFAVQVGEIAATATRHEYFFADLVGAFENNDLSTTIAGGNRTHEPGSTATDDDHVGCCHGGSIAAPVFLDL